MSLGAGTRLGPYEIQAVAGAGGMGEVYKARDTRLDRTVAIKVLPRELAGDPQFRQRFDREARTISALDHPHICALFDVGEESGEAYLVMQYLEGETLADRLARGPIPIDDALLLGGQIADALDKAHRQGIVHRDLKPGNIMLTRPGAARSGPLHAKLLDFGLAKPGGAVVAHAGGSMAATQEGSITAQGTFLGTLQYMAPEQIEGREADARSDIFAFGGVLYEMLTGTRAFTGKSAPSLIAAILEHDPPPIGAQQKVAPAALDHVVRRCLAKDPDDRWATARDVRLELGWIAERLHTAAPAPAALAPGPWRQRALWAAVAVLLGVLAATWAIRERPTLVTTRVSIILADMPLLNYGGIGPMQTLAVSPDGRYVAHITWLDSRPGPLHVRALGRFESTRLEGTEGGVTPFFSPDGRWVGFNIGRTMKKVPRDGGPVVSLAELPSTPRGQPVWLADNVIVAAAGPTLVSVPGDGGPPTSLFTAANGDTEYGSLAAIGDGRVLLVSERPKSASWNDGRIAAYDMTSGTHKVVVEQGYAPQYTNTGHLLFARGGQLVATRFDAGSLAVSGSPVAVLDDVTLSPAWGFLHAGIGIDGTLVYVPAAAATARQLVWVSRTGEAQPAITILRPFEHPRLSASGDRIVVGMRPGTDLWVGDVARGTLERLTFSPLEDESPVWHPDGLRVAFAAGRGPARHTLMKNADGSGDEVLLFDHGPAAANHHHLGAWSPDGRVLAYSFNEGAADWSLGAIRTADKPTTETFVKTEFNEQAATFSPDGRWLAYASDETGRSEVYIRPFPGPGGKQQVSADGGAEPLWSRGGRELFYLAGDRMMAVAVTGAATLSVGVPRMLFQGTYARIPWGERNYDVAPDGRFLMLTTGGQSATELRVVLNWFEELKRIVP
jgi:hypothetical protein